MISVHSRNIWTIRFNSVKVRAMYTDCALLLISSLRFKQSQNFSKQVWWMCTIAISWWLLIPSSGKFALCSQYLWLMQWHKYTKFIYFIFSDNLINDCSLKSISKSRKNMNIIWIWILYENNILISSRKQQLNYSLIISSLENVVKLAVFVQ